MCISHPAEQVSRAQPHSLVQERQGQPLAAPQPPGGMSGVVTFSESRERTGLADAAPRPPGAEVKAPPGSSSLR